MASRKISRSKKAVSAGRAGILHLLLLPLHPNAITVYALLLAGAGVWLLHKGNAVLGFAFLCIPLALLAAVLLDAFPSWDRIIPARRSAAPGKRRGKAKVRSLQSRSFSLVLEGLQRQKAAWGGLILVLLGFFLGALSQAGVVNSPEVPGWKLWGLYLLAGILFTAGLFLLRKKGETDPPPIPEKVEWTAFGMVMLLAAFLRIFRLGSMPSGMFIDQGMEGWAALRIIHEHSYWPVWEFDVWQNPALLLYQLAGWFLCLSPFHCVPSQSAFYLFYALLSLATLPLVYWTFRQIGGQRLALLGLFILAVMRWNINFSRNGFPTIEVPFYMFGMLAFLTYSMRPTKSRFFYPAAAAVGVFFLFGCLPFLILAFGSVLGGMRLSAVLTVAVLLAGLACAVYLWKASKNKEAYLSAVIAGIFFAMGLYTYQAYKIVPLLILLFALYELAANRKTVLANWKSLAGFSAVFLVFAFPYFKHTLATWGQGSREGELLIFSRVHEQHSWQPLVYNLWRTAVMFHWHGDAMSRHNIQDYRMLDDVTGVLFFLGVVGALAFLRKKPWFYGLVGLLVMTIPCVLSIDAAHANRMLGTTPFIALLAALPLAALWGRFRSLFGEKGNLAFPLLFALPLSLMALQNYDAYFRIMSRSVSSWSEYSARETAIGKAVAQYGDDYDYYISPVYYNYYTINYFGYFHQDRLHPLLLPDSQISHSPALSRGVYYAIEQGRKGVLDMLQSLYPGGSAEYLVDPAGNTAEYFYRVPASIVAKMRGLTARFDRPVGGLKESQINQFPGGLPRGPYRAILSGNIYVPQTGDYKWEFKGNIKAALRVKNQRGAPGGYFHVEKGEHAIEVELTVPEGIVPALTIQQTPQTGIPFMLDAGSFDSLSPPRGLLGRYFHDPEGNGMAFLEEWDPVLNYTNGNDFSALATGSIRWTGTLVADESGPYRFLSSPANLAQIKVDGESLADAARHDVILKKGPHPIELFLGNARSCGSFSFLWVKPDGTAEVVPNSAFGEVR